MIGAPGDPAGRTRWAPHECGCLRAVGSDPPREPHPPAGYPAEPCCRHGRPIKPIAAPAAVKQPHRGASEGIRCRMLERWLAEAGTGAIYVYHRGELGRDKLHDPDLAAVADRLLELSTGRFDVVSGCGHVRGEIIGDGTVELLTRREGGQTVYLARKRPAAASA